MILTIIKLITALPKLQALVELFIVEYTKICISNMKKENRDAIEKSLKEHSQIPIEEAFGSENAGKVIDQPGSYISDMPPPNVMRGSDKKTN